MTTNRQKTLDDLEPVIPLHLDEAIENRQATQKSSYTKHYSCKGRQLYEKIQEQKALESLYDPVFD